VLMVRAQISIRYSPNARGVCKHQNHTEAP
jgi:hypothetical protein